MHLQFFCCNESYENTSREGVHDWIGNVLALVLHGTGLRNRAHRVGPIPRLQLRVDTARGPGRPWAPTKGLRIGFPTGMEAYIWYQSDME